MGFSEKKIQVYTKIEKSKINKYIPREIFLENLSCGINIKNYSDSQKSQSLKNLKSLKKIQDYSESQKSESYEIMTEFSAFKI